MSQTERWVLVHHIDGTFLIRIVCWLAVTISDYMFVEGVVCHDYGLKPGDSTTISARIRRWVCRQ